MSLNLLEPSGPVQACIGTALLYSYHISSVNLDSGIQAFGSRDHVQLLTDPQTP